MRNLPAKAPLALVGASHVVTLLDPVTLAPTKSGAELGEYHDTYSFSPDGSEVAFGISAPSETGGGRDGVRLVDARKGEVTGSVNTGVYAGGVAWLEPDRLVAVLGDSFVCTPSCPSEDPDFSKVVTVNPSTGETLESSRVQHSCDTSEMRGRALLSLSERDLSIIGSDGRVEVVELPRPLQGCGGTGSSLTGKEAFVISPNGGALGQVTLETSRLVTHHFSDGGRIKEAIGLKRNRVVLARRNGIEVFDTRTTRRQSIDPSADEVRVSGRKLLAFGGGMGVRAYDLDGRRQFSVLGGERVTDVGIAGRFAYAISKNGVAVADLSSGKVLDRSSTRFRGDLLAEPSAP